MNEISTGGKRSNILLEQIFGLAKAGTNPRTEFVAGLTTFLTMVYIVFVNPQILGNTGMDKRAVFVATCIAAAVSTLVMAFYANYPIALAPGMGLNAFFAFTVVLAMKYTWQQALAAVFCSGVVFFFISIFRIREYIINAIPRNLKLAISAGVGLFLGIIALEESKIVVASPATLVTLGAGLADADGNLPRMKQALIADSFAAMFGSLFGTSTTTSYIESAAGVAAGGRTGLTAFFVAIFFLATLCFAPLAGMVPAYASSAALLYVACVMARGLAEMDWDDMTEAVPAVVAAVTMPLTYSIATGIGLGFITYALIKLIAGRFADAKPAVLVLALIFAVKFALG